MKRRRLGAPVIGLGVLLVGVWSPAARAEAPVSGLALGVERVFGFVSNTASEETDNVTTTRSSTGFSLGNAGLSQGAPELGYFGSYSAPRLGVDYILPGGLSFGGAFGVSTFGIEREVDGGAVSVSTQGDVTNLLLAPRVGYVVDLGKHFAVWPRGGVTFIHASVERDIGGDSTATFGAFTLEAPFFYLAKDFLGFMATPALDLGVLGSREEGGNEVDGEHRVTEFGIMLGLFVVL